jgi:sugar-specific transcriptional regulator TrmB
VAVDALTELGLSTYAARTFVALVGLGGGTAEDVSDVAEVPRTRVYDAAEELHDHGLVDVQQSTPKRFWPVSTETAGQHLQRYYERRAVEMREALEDVGPVERTSEQRGVWTVTGRDPVTDRVIEFVDEATDEIVLMSVERLLTDELVERLRAASDRGVSVRIAGISDGVESSIREAVPGVELFESIWVWSDTPAGRLLMVDREKTLVSELVPVDGDYPPEPRDETAIWGASAANSLVIVIRAMFTWQLDSPSE